MPRASSQPRAICSSAAIRNRSHSSRSPSRVTALRNIRKAPRPWMASSSSSRTSSSACARPNRSVMAHSWISKLSGSFFHWSVE